MPPVNLRESVWRTLLTFNVTRVVIALLLLAYLIFHGNSEAGEVAQFPYWQTCIAYLVLAVLFAVFAVYYRHRLVMQLLLQIAVDITVISLLYAAAGGAFSGLAILYLFPLAGGAILLPLVWALFLASAVTLFLLAESGYQIFMLAPGASFSQAGLDGAAFFASVFLINRLAAKLISQEELANRRGQALQTQEAINRLVIADMGDGILVVGRDSTVQISNPAAERMLGISASFDTLHYRLTDIPALMPIAEGFFEWLNNAADRKMGDAATFVVIKPGDEAISQSATTAWGWRRELALRLKLRFCAVNTIGQDGDRTIIFLQDVTEIENQAQQLKLASMGRLTGSIAHEVRNPLSAISYAASLLAEDTANLGRRRLLNIIADNVTRLNRMIEDILKLSRKAHIPNDPIALLPFFLDIVAELQQTHALPSSMLDVADMDEQRVRFDPLHLREVVINLLSNALRYASGKQGSIRIYPVSDSGRLELHIQDDGAAIAPEVRAHLFEPFYTTSSKGTGLGLYVARELCLNNGAMLDYEYRMGNLDAGADERMDEGADEIHGRFVITFAAT
ncbi:MAG: sensor histidine kinase [Burkholderiales bacterium]